MTLMRFGFSILVTGCLLMAPLSGAPLGNLPLERAPSPAEKIRQELDKTIPIDIQEQPLHLAFEYLKEKAKINFVLDQNTMAQIGIDPEQVPVTLRSKDLKLRTALRNLLSPHNLSFAIIGDTVVITTDEQAMVRQLRQRVSVNVDQLEFVQVIKQLARETGTNLILDSRVTKEAQGKVSLQLDEVPLQTAVLLLAEMASLKPVRVGNVLFITTKVNAKELREDPEVSGPHQPIDPNSPQVMPVPPGINGR